MTQNHSFSSTSVSDPPLVLMSNSEITTAMRCWRKWLVTWYLGFVKATEPAASHMKLGSRVHTALEGRAQGLDPLLVLTVIYRIEIEAHPDEAEDLIAEQKLALAMTEGFIEWEAEEGKAADWELVPGGAEREVSVALPGVPGAGLRAKLDRVLMQTSTGLLYFDDYKTGADFERTEGLPLDPQMRMYSLIQQLLTAGVPDAPVVGGGRVTQLRRVLRTAKSKPPYYLQTSFRYSPAVISATHLKVQHWASLIMEHRAALDWVFSDHGGRGDMELLEALQLAQLAANQIPRDCAWSCPLAGGLCYSMDDGSAWMEQLASSGHWVQADPYAYYSDTPLDQVRLALAGNVGGPQ